MPSQHAILSASSAHRWLNCTPSVKLCETFEDKPSEYAAEGTEAHELCEYKLKTALGMEADDPTPKLSRFNDEMEECANGYASYVLEQVNEASRTCSDPKDLIEQRVDFSRWVPEGFGTADCVIIADGTLRVVDYKHGLGVLVEAEMNPQMMCYALGAMELFDALYDISKVSMTIYQPRRENISTFEISREELLTWADKVLKHAAKLAFEGKGEFRCGEWCGFCKAKHRCRARAEENLLMARHEFKLPALLDDIEIELILFYPRLMSLPPGHLTLRIMPFRVLLAVKPGPAGSWWKGEPTADTPMRMKSSRLYVKLALIRSRRRFSA